MNSPINVAIIIRKVDKNYIATSPSFPGCTTGGNTIAETIHSMEIALKAYVKAMVEDGDEIPAGIECVAMTAIPVAETGEKLSWGERLRSWRKARGFTQAQLADKFQVVKATISDWENDKRDLPGTLQCFLEG